MTDRPVITSVPRRLEPGEELAFARAVMEHFHEDESDEDLQRFAEALRTEPNYRPWVVPAPDGIAGNLGVFVTDLSVPGGARLPVAAITAVGVAQTHRRRGLLRAMMTACLDEAVELGEPVAALYASEASIYGRFGFGPSAPSVTHQVQTEYARFRDPVDVRLVEGIAAEAALAAFPPVFEASRDRRAGVGRTATQWRQSFLEDPPSQRGGASGRRLVHVPGRGYAAYRVRPRSEHDLPAGVVEVRDLVATDPEAEAALWQYVCDIDLTTTMVCRLRPPDEAFPLLLQDQDRVRTSVSSALYTRILDVPRVFESRVYEASGRTVLRIHDGFRGTAGTWRLEVDDDGVCCRPTTADPDLELSVDAVSAVWLGGTRTTRLVDARQAVEVVPGAAAALDRLVRAPRAPWTSFMF